MSPAARSWIDNRGLSPKNMEKIDSYTASDGKKLFYRSWNSGISDAPALILVHGIESHSGWFSEAGEKLANMGIDVFALDRRGSGLNTEGRGDIDNFQILIRDIHDFFSEKLSPDRKCIMMAGLCWGARLALYFFLSNHKMISRLVFITPGFKTKLHMPFIEKIKWFFAVFLHLNSELPLPIKDEMFTDDKNYLRKIKEDKLRLRKITPRFFRANLNLERALLRVKRQFDTPCILFLAEKDEIIDNNGVIKYLKGYFKDIDVVTYPGSRHGLFFEPARDELIRDLKKEIACHRECQKMM